MEPGSSTNRPANGVLVEEVSSYSQQQPEQTKGGKEGSVILNSIANTPPFLVLLATLAIFSLPVLGAWLNLLPVKVTHVIRDFSEALVKLP
jgi:hypothetical protein